VTTGDSTNLLACANTSYTLNLYSSSQSWAAATTLYTDNGLSTPVSGGNNWYSDGCNALQINNSGQVIGTYDCGC
jgi:hypothetical protein